MENHKRQMKSKNATITLIIIGIGIVLAMITSWTSWKQAGNVTLKVDREILSFDSLKNTQIEVVGNQIIKVTQDSITAYDLEGEQLWTDTLTLDSIVIQKRGNYIAVSSKNGRNIHIFNDKGKQGEIVVQNAIISFSVNRKGQIAVIEQFSDGHQVSTYNERGEWSGVKRVTYTKTDGYPMAAEISPNGMDLIISYIDMNEPKLTSCVQVIPMQRQSEEKIDQVKYGLKEQNNLIFEIEFINDDIWASIGDTGTTFYALEDGKEIKHLPKIYPTYVPYLNQLPHNGGYLPMVVGEMAQGTSIHNKERLIVLDQEGNLVLEQAMEAPITYYYADQRGVIIGTGRLFEGYNKMGVKQFEFKATQDIQRVVYLGQKSVAITKDKVLLLKEEMRGNE